MIHYSNDIRFLLPFYLILFPLLCNSSDLLQLGRSFSVLFTSAFFPVISDDYSNSAPVLLLWNLNFCSLPSLIPF